MIRQTMDQAKIALKTNRSQIIFTIFVSELFINSLVLVEADELFANYLEGPGLNSFQKE